MLECTSIKWAATKARARDRELSPDSSPEASEVSDSRDSGGSDESVDRRLRREVDQYDRIMARAHEIAKKRPPASGAGAGARRTWIATVIFQC
jgi:hypothetical protein